MAGFEHTTLKNTDGCELHVYKWLPSEGISIRGAVQIAHGMAEWAARYEEFAVSLSARGYAVYANDHRGHGRTAGSPENIGYTGRDGFNGMVRDMNTITGLIRKDYPGLPIFLFGHSMGSFLAQLYISKWGSGLKGVILSGSNGNQGIALYFGTLIARVLVALFGVRTRSRLLNYLTFGSFNRAFKPVRTDFDWLSRDTEEVNKYIADPYCGGVFTTGFFLDFFRGLKSLYDDRTVQGIPRELPIFILSGDRDPVGEFGKGPLRLAKFYRDLGMKDVNMKLYEQGRHEILHEINRNEAVEDIIAWIDAHCIPAERNSTFSD